MNRYAKNFTNNAYHGTVVWSWQLAMMAAGLERQLDRCNSADVPEFCGNNQVFGRVKEAYNSLWDILDANRAVISSEVWSWVYQNGKYVITQLGAFPPPPGVNPTGKFCFPLSSSSVFVSCEEDKV